MTDFLPSIPNNDGRFAAGGNQNYKIEKIWERHEEVARRIVRGETNVQIAAALDCTPQTISNIRNNPIVKVIIDEFRKQRNERTAEIVREVQAVAPRAIKLLQKTIDNDTGDLGQPGGLSQKPTVGDQLRAASEVLKNSIPRSIDINAIDKNPAEITEAELEIIKRNSIELRKRRGLIEDAEFTDMQDEKNGEQKDDSEQAG